MRWGFLLAEHPVVQTAEQKRAWLVTLILAVCVSFLVLLFALLVLRLLLRQRATSRRSAGRTVALGAASAWSEAGARATPAGGPPADGVLEPDEAGPAADWAEPNDPSGPDGHGGAAFEDGQWEEDGEWRDEDEDEDEPPWRQND